MIIVRWLLNAIALLLVAALIPGFHISSIYTALIAALILGLINAIIRPIILILTLPINLLTLGTFTLVINALMLLLASSVVKGFVINGFWAAFFAAILLWIISMLTNLFIEAADDPE